METKRTKTVADKTPKQNNAPTSKSDNALSFSWEDVAPDRAPEDFQAVHRFTSFENRFFMAFGHEVHLAPEEVLGELRKGRHAVCQSFVERQFWLGLCLYAVRFETMARNPKIERGEVDRATDRAVAHVEEFKKRFPDLWRNADECAFLDAFDLVLHDSVHNEFFAPLEAIHDRPQTTTNPAPPAALAEETAPTSNGEGGLEVEQEQAAADFGVSVRTIRRWEKGESRNHPAGYSRETRRRALDYKVFVEDWKRNKALEDRRKNLVREDRNGMTIHKGRG